MVELIIKHKQMHKYLNDILCRWVDDGSPVDVVFLDFRKLSIKCHIIIVLLKLKAHGIGDGVINWIKKIGLQTEDRE